MSVKMHTDMPFEDFIDPYALKNIVDSRTFDSGNWRPKTKLKDFQNGIDKVVIPVDISQYKILVVTETAAGRTIKAHSHDDEPMFRYLLSGSFKLNGIEYSIGEWVIVPVGMTYEIHTDTGYTTLAGYGMSCQCSAQGGH